MLRRASPRPRGPRGLSAVLGRGLVWGRSDRLGPGAQGTLGPSVTVPGRSLGTGDASGPEPAEQEGETSLPPVPSPCRARHPPMQATLCRPLPAHRPPRPAACMWPPGPSSPSSCLLPRPGGCGPSGRAHGALGPRPAGKP